MTSNSSIYTTSVDYLNNSNNAKKFFSTVKNKLHFAITGNTAAEIIADRAHSSKPNMGLTTWRKAPDGKTFLSDTTIAQWHYFKEQLTA